MKNSVGIIPVFVSHMGCPNDCVFCNQRKINGVDDAISPNELEAFVQSYLETMKRDQIELAFFGGSFTGIEKVRQDAYLSVASDLKQRGLVDKIRLSTRPDYVDEKVIKTLIKYKVDLVELGCQSFDDQVLIVSKRGHSSSVVAEAVTRLKIAGIEVGIQLMLGLPGDNFEKFRSSVAETVRLAPSCVRLYPALVIKDTELEAIYLNGMYKPLTVDDAMLWCAWALNELNHHHIPVIRMGLQRTDLIDFDSAVIAGPFHPAFGELVLSKVFKNKVEAWLKNNIQKVNNFKCISIWTHPSQLSMMIGQNKINLKSFFDMLSIGHKQMVIKSNLEVDYNTVWIAIDDHITKITIMN